MCVHTYVCVCRGGKLSTGCPSGAAQVGGACVKSSLKVGSAEPLWGPGPQFQPRVGFAELRKIEPIMQLLGFK